MQAPVSLKKHCSHNQYSNKAADFTLTLCELNTAVSKIQDILLLAFSYCFLVIFLHRRSHPAMHKGDFQLRV